VNPVRGNGKDYGREGADRDRRSDGQRHLNAPGGHARIRRSELSRHETIIRSCCWRCAESQNQPPHSITSAARAMSFTNGCILICINAVARKHKCDVLATRQHVELKRRVTMSKMRICFLAAVAAAGIGLGRNLRCLGSANERKSSRRNCSRA
jgi:hypothetical protein